MKMVSKWIADGCASVPEAVACTSKSQYWSIPQSRCTVTNVPIPEMNVIVTDTDKDKNADKRYPKRVFGQQ